MYRVYNIDQIHRLFNELKRKKKDLVKKNIFLCLSKVKDNKPRLKYTWNI